MLAGVLAAAGLATATPACAAAAADGTPGDPREGSWTLVSADSTIKPPNTLSVTGGHDGVHVVMTGQTRMDFTAKGDGLESPVARNPAFDHVELRKIDGKQAEIIEKKNGAVVATVRDKLSKDGDELTVTNAVKGHPDVVKVWERTGGKKAHGNPVAGDWTESPSKSRMRQGLVLKITADGSGEVRFVGDYSYTGRFDGKAYDVKDSPNDTVMLQLADPHTVNAIFKRDDQVTQQDKWVVSGDGQRMTLTSAGTLETGQKVSEKLVFKKQ